MRLTQYTDYSLRVLIYVGLKDGAITTIQAVTDAYGISRSHLMKVVRQLAHEGFLEAVRGQGGGLRLGLPPEQIRLGELVRRMEPDLAMVECFRPEGRCAIEPACVLPGILEGAVNAFIAELDRYTLADLLPARASKKLIRLLNL